MVSKQKTNRIVNYVLSLILFLALIHRVGTNRLVPTVNNTARISSIFRPAYAPHENLWHRQQTNQVIPC